MKITLVTPAAVGELKGNRVTAERWAQRLEELGHEPEIATSWAGEPADLLVALHAVKSGESIQRWRADRPDAPLIVALTGTDAYGGLDEQAIEGLRQAARIIALQPLAKRCLPDDLHDKVDVILQSAMPPSKVPSPRMDRFEVCVIANLREVKDPLLAARAMRHVPEQSLLHVAHIGEAMDAELGAAAKRENADNPRYTWLGAQPHEATVRRLAQSRVLALTSRNEGGANVISEAIVCGVPVVTTAIDGSIGLLGDDWPATFPVGDDQALAELLVRCEQEPTFLATLAHRSVDLIGPFTPGAERASWAEVLDQLPR